jgi:hypothetical protein
MQKTCKGAYRRIVGAGFLILAVILFILGANALFLAITTILNRAALAGPISLLFTLLEALIFLTLGIVLCIIGAARIRH